MIRWSYALPRLLLVVGLGAAFWFGLDPLTRRLVVAGGEALFAAKVEIAELSTSLRPLGISARGLKIANHWQPGKNLVEADEVAGYLDPRALAQQKLVLRQARLLGLRIDTDRDTSGKRPWEWQMPDGPLVDLGEQWFDRATALLEDSLRQQVEQLESVQLARELLVRWPREYKQAENRLGSLKLRIDGLEAMFESRSGDLFEQLDKYRQAAVELETLRREVVDLKQSIERLPRQAAIDREAVIAAADRDLVAIQQRIDLVTLQPEALSHYFLGRELGDSVLELMRAVKAVREQFADIDPAEPQRGRGTDVVFSATPRHPRFLAESIELSGQWTFKGKPYGFSGQACNLTTDPKLLGRPATVALRLAAQSPIDVWAMIDRSGPVARERLVLRAPSMATPARLVGRPERLALEIAPGAVDLYASVEFVGKRLTGQVFVRQESLRMAPRFNGDHVGPRLAASLAAAMSEIRSAEVAIELNGTSEKPQWRFQSSLGPQLVACFNGLIRRELEQRQVDLTVALQKHIDDELAHFQQAILIEQDELLGKLDTGHLELQKLTQAIARRTPIPKADQLLASPLSKLNGARF